ncbi:hypothetical protein [Kribbella sp. NPDC051620]|uniref:hypothetical protein n=1 Tax=Kribbella sp. NPDC051620 TaxID=3364120 RepID=UPI003791DA9E
MKSHPRAGPDNCCFHPLAGVGTPSPSDTGGSQLAAEDEAGGSSVGVQAGGKPPADGEAGGSGLGVRAGGKLSLVVELGCSGPGYRWGRAYGLAAEECHLRTGLDNCCFHPLVGVGTPGPSGAGGS